MRDGEAYREDSCLQSTMDSRRDLIGSRTPSVLIFLARLPSDKMQRECLPQKKRRTKQNIVFAGHNCVREVIHGKKMRARRDDGAVRTTVPRVVVFGTRIDEEA